MSQNEEERLAALQSYNILDTAEEEDFDELTVLASAISQTPIALISLIDKERQWFKASTGTAVKQTPLEESFCVHAITSENDIMIVEDAHQDPRFANNPLVTGDLNITFYAGVPLINEDGFALGSLCVIDHQKKQLSHEQTIALKILAKQVVDKLELRRKSIALHKVNQELRDSNMFIQKFASTAAHDIKNPLSSILLTSQALKMRLQKLGDEGCIKLVDLNISSTKTLVTLLNEMLEYSKSPSLLLQKKGDVSLLEVLNRVISLINIPPNFDIELPNIDAYLNVSVVALEQIFINLLTNAIRYNNKDQCFIKVRYSNDKNFYRFEVEDNGIGIKTENHEKIFNDHFTLEISDRNNEKGTGIGLSTVKGLVNALQGAIHLTSVVGKGTTFYFSIKK